MNVSTEILAILVTVACGVMTINMAVMKFLWDDLKQTKRDQAEIREDVATKADIVKYCEPKHAEGRKEMSDTFCKKVDSIKQQLDELWERINHHSHDEKTGRVLLP